MQAVIQGTPADFHRFLERYHLHCAVLKYPSTRFLPNPFDFYFPRTRWALIYWDDLAMIFVERTPDVQDLIRKNEFQEARPDDNPEYWLNSGMGRRLTRRKSAHAQGVREECPPPSGEPARAHVGGTNGLTLTHILAAVLFV